MLRREFEAYCQWVAAQLSSVRFGHRVDAIRPCSEGGWSVWTRGVEHRARAVVLGVGCVPSLPEFARGLTHSSGYLTVRDQALAARSVAVIGSGQSAAEVFADVLEYGSGRLDWFTRSAGFLPMEYSKLGLEHFSPEYTAYFHALPEERRDALRAKQDLLYKGIDAGTSERIYDLLYRRSVDGEPDVGYAARCELRDVAGTRLDVPPTRPGPRLHRRRRRDDPGHRLRAGGDPGARAPARSRRRRTPGGRARLPPADGRRHRLVALRAERRAALPRRRRARPRARRPPQRGDRQRAVRAAGVHGARAQRVPVVWHRAA